MRPYIKLGLPSYFYPFLGAIKRLHIYEHQHKDAFYYYKELAAKNPNAIAEVINFGNYVGINLLDSKITKEFYAKQSCYNKIFFSKAISTLVGTGLVFSEGNLWKSHRKAISSIFHFEFLKKNVPLIVNTTREFFNNLMITSLQNVNIMDEIQKITGEIVGRIFFGENLNHYTLKGKPLTLYLQELVTRNGLVHQMPIVFFFRYAGFNLEWIPVFKQLMNDIKELRRLCYKIVQDRKLSKANQHDLLGLLLQTQNNPLPEDNFSDEDIIDEFITFFIAGMDTTGHLITMALYLISKNPQYTKKLEEEIKLVYSRTNPATIDNLNQMELMHAILKETLRLYTPAPTIFPRVAQVDHELMGLKIKKGMLVRPTPIYNYSNAKYFDQPLKFKPERWFDKKEHELDPFVYIPFSAGARNCIGQHLAILEAKIIISEFLKTFRYKIVPENYRLVMTFNFLYEPKIPLLMNLYVK